MTPERWREVERLYQAAIARAENERHDFLAGACGADEELRREVETLLAQSDSTWPDLGHAAVVAARSLMKPPATTSMIGRRIRTYELVGVLGAGGMGRVYRARDSRLGRDVAIKLLPTASKADPDRIARFEREAQVLAALKHPHIGAIYGLEETAEVTALVMELVEGEDLAARLARGPLPARDALTIARQIADALDAAHEIGIIHRDLKPANVCLQRDGTVKVVDFGLAKPLQQAVEITPTLPDISRAPGAVIGTPAYMSPEQARGEAAGREADIWAFGVVLYEMLTGRSPFSRPTTAETLAFVLSAPVDEQLFPLDTPEGVRRLIRRCLARDPKRRIRHMGDVRNEIDEALSAPSMDVASVPPTPLRVNAAVSRRALGWAAALGLAALVLGYIAFASRGEQSPEEVRLQMAPPAGMHFVSVPAVSPDGRQLVFAAAPNSGGDARLWLRPLATTAATELPGTVGASYPFWSANGRSVGFFADGQMKRVAVAGGNPVVVCEASEGKGGLWLDDDTIVFAPTANSPLLRVGTAGGVPVALTRLADDESGHRFPQRLPGRQLLYYSVNRTPEKSATRLITIDSPDQPIRLFPGLVVAEYAKGALLFARGRAGAYTLLAQPMTLPDGQLTGEPVEIGRTRISETLGRAVMAASPSGVIVTLGPIESVGHFTWLSRDGRVLDTVGAPAVQMGVELSPDRQQVATFRSGEIWALNLSRPVPSRLTTGVNRHPIWSPDGGQILTLDQGRGNLGFDLVTTTTTSAEVKTLRQAPGFVKPMGWTRDHRLVWIEGMPSGSSIWMMDSNGQAREVFRESAWIAEARVSPDGRWIAYSSNRSGRFEIELSRFPEFGQRYPLSVAGGGYPRWRGDGKEIFFLSADRRLMAASFVAGPSPSVGTPTSLFEVDLVAHPDRLNFAAYEYDAAGDGSRFLINRLVSPPDESLSMIVDWNPPR